MKQTSTRRVLVALTALCITASLTPPARAQVTSDQLKAFQWRAIGPAATGGRILDVDVDPRNPYVIYAASASAGLWKTTNNGTTWTCVFEKEGTLSIGDIAVDPSNPDTIWVGTGEANNQRSSLYGDGIYKSTDGGKTWEHKGLRDTQHIGRVVVHPQDSNTVYVASPGNEYSFSEARGVFKTTDGGESWEKVLYVNPAVGVIDLVIDPKDPNTLFAASYERLRRAWDFDGSGPGSGIYRTQDGGENWERLRGGLPSGEIGRIGLTIYPPDPKIVYATVPNNNTSPQAPGIPDDDEFVINDDGLRTPYGVFLIEEGLPRVVSLERNSVASGAGLRADDIVESFGGEKITDLTTLMNRLKAARPGDNARWVVRRGENTREVNFTVPRSQGRSVGGEIYKTEDGGETWTKVNERPVSGSPDYYYGQIRVDPLDVNRLYLLSVPVHFSDDGGKTWSQGGASSVHVDHHALWINPNDSNHVILGNDGGFHVSYDRCVTWDRVNNIPLAQFYAIGYDMQDPYHVFGGTQDNGTWGGPSSGGVTNEDWYRVSGGDGFYVQPDPTNHNIIISESQFGAIGRSNRATGQRVSIRPPASDPGGVPDRYNWSSPILLSHADPRVVYFGGNKLFKSFNRGDDWLVISPDLTTADPTRIAGNVPYCTITTIAESPLDRDVLLVGTDDGNVQWTNDGGENWTNMARRFPLRPTDWWCTRVELSHHDRDTAYVSFSGYRDDDFRPFVFKTTDGGDTWQTIISGLPSFGPVNVVKEDAKNPNLLYCGTDFGTFVSLDAGEHWAEITNNCPRVAVHDLFVHPRENELVIGTHGRGFFIVDVSPLQTLTATALRASAHLNPIADIDGPVSAGGFRGGGGGFGDGDKPFVAPGAPGGIVLSYYLQKASEDDVTLRIVNREGRAVRTLQASNAAGVNIVRWDGRGRAPRGGGQGRGGRRGRGRGGAGQRLPAGDYAVELIVGEETYRREFDVR